jgi:hypothetical protein
MTATDGLNRALLSLAAAVTDPAAATPSLASYGPQSAQPTELSQSSGADAAPCSCYAAKQPRNATNDLGFGEAATYPRDQEERSQHERLVSHAHHRTDSVVPRPVQKVSAGSLTGPE